MESSNQKVNSESNPTNDGYGYGYGYGYDSGGHLASGKQRSFKDYLGIFIERIWFFIAALFIVMIAATLYTFNKTEVFTAYAKIRMLRDDPSALGQGVYEVGTDQIRSAEDLNTYIGIFESAKIIYEVNDRIQGDLKERFMAPFTDSINIGGPLTPIEVLGRDRKIIPSRMSLIINIAYTHPDPAVASEVANLFAQTFIAYNYDLNIDGSLEAVDDLKVRANQQRAVVEKLEMQLAEYRESEQAVSLDSQENIAREQLAALNAKKLGAKYELDQINNLSDLVEQYTVEKRALWELDYIANQSHVANLLQKISENKIQISALSKRYRAKHPQMVALNQALSESEKELVLAVRNSVDKLKSARKQAQKDFELASLRLDEKTNDLINLSKKRVVFNSLRRELEVQEQFFQALNERMTSEEAQVSLKKPNVRIIDEAVPPLHPSSPNIPLNLAAGFFGGIAAGFGLVFLVAFLDDRIKSAMDIEGALGISILGILPRLKKMSDTDKAKVVAGDSDFQVTETYRSIYSALKLNKEGSQAQVIMTTSTIPSEGKSFVSSNLALTFSSHGERTLLLDCDLRLPNVAKSLGLKNDYGLIQILEGNKTVDDAIQHAIYPGFDVLPTGGKSSQSTQLLNSPAFAQLLNELRQNYDRILIDCPPLAAVSDALNIVSLTDGIIYVIKYNTVKRASAALNVERINKSETPILGALLNDVSGTGSGYYYSQYSNSQYEQYA